MAIGGPLPRPRAYVDSPTTALRVIPNNLPSGFATGKGGFGTQPDQQMAPITGGFGASRGYAPGTQGLEMTGIWDPRVAAGFPSSRGGGVISTPATSRMLSFAESARNQAQVVGQGPPPRRDPRFDTVGEATDIVQDSWQEQYDRFQAGMAAEEDAVRAGYSPVIEGLEDQIGDLRAAATALGIPFDEYLAQLETIGSDVGNAPGLSASLVPVVTKMYDDAEVELKGAFGNIEKQFGREAAATIVGRMREFQGTVEDVIRTDESAIALLHEKSGEYAKALAQAAHSNDVYGALDAETRIQATLDNQIEESAEELARQKKAMQASIDAARDKFAAAYEYEDPSFDMVWQESLNEYFESNNVPPHERQQAMNIYQQIMDSDSSYGLNEGSFRRGINDYFNQGALKAIGLDPDTIKAAVEESGDDSILQLMAGDDIGGMFRRGNTGQLEIALAKSKVYGGDIKKISSLIARGSRVADDLPSTSDPEVKHLRNMFTTRQTVSQNWDSIVSSFGPKINEGDLIVAPNGYVNPVVGGAKYSNDWGNPRGGGTRSHEGTDMFAPKGTPVVSPVDGVIKSIDYGKLGGNFVKVQDGNGNVHYLAHLDTQSPNISIGQRVRAGTVVGTVGNTGNARTTPPHLHYGIYTSNGATNPFPVLESAKNGQNAYVGAGARYNVGGSSRGGTQTKPTKRRGTGAGSAGHPVKKAMRNKSLYGKNR